MKRICAWC